MDFLLPIIGVVITFFVSYFVIRLAVTHALISHYKTVRLYERTGEWLAGPHDARSPANSTNRILAF